MGWLVYLRFDNCDIHHIQAKNEFEVREIIESAQSKGLKEFKTFHGGRASIKLKHVIQSKPWECQDNHNHNNHNSEHVKNLVFEKTRRLHLLEIQQAKLGVNVDPAIEIEIKDIKSEINKLLDSV